MKHDEKKNMIRKDMVRDKNRHNERGNVLFLILIAVALFAALSYAVTQSTRSGSNDQSREQNLIGSAQVTQYPAGVRTALIRMVIGGVPAENLIFDAPSFFDSTTDATDTDNFIEDANDDTSDERSAVFHPAGGGAPYQLAQPEVMASASQGEWVFTDRYDVVQIGRTVAASGQGNELIAFLPGITRGLCERINEEFGIGVDTDVDGDGIPPSGISVANVPDLITHGVFERNSPAFTDAQLDTIDAVEFRGQAYGCFDLDDSDAGGLFVYYHVLLER